MSRARRSTAKKVDYAKEQEFSDADDIFEDSEPEEPPPSKRRGRKPKAGTGVRTAVVTANHEDDDDDAVYETHPVYTEKAYDPTLAPIRDRFQFLPEYEEDGSPRIELIVGRRPVDEKEDAPDKADGNSDEDEAEDEAVGRRATRGRGKADDEKKKSSPSKKGKNDSGASGSGPVEYEYLVKFKGRSYLHLEWMTGADLESMNKSAKGIYRRYLKKLAQGYDEELESPDFDPSYIVPEKVLDEADQEITIELSDKELLKWEKQREKELAAEGSDDSEDDGEEKKTDDAAKKVTDQNGETENDEKKGESVILEK